MPQSKMNPSPVFEKRYEDLMAYSEASLEAPFGDQILWYRPESLTGDLTDPDAPTESFSRRAINEEAIEALKDPDDPGTTGDIVAAVTMIDALSVMERAYRNRHMGRIRRLGLVVSRNRGHASSTGVFGFNAIEYARTIIESAKELDRASNNGS